MYVALHGPEDAPPVLLLHGGGVAGWMWDSLTTHLQHHAVIVPDLPGHGRSAEEPYISHAAAVEQLAHMLRTQFPDRPVAVVGFSLGAQLAVLLASEHPDLVDRVVVVSAQAKSLPFGGLALAMLRVSAPLARQPWFARLQARELSIPPHLMAAYLDTSAGITRASLVAAVGSNLEFRLPQGWASFPGRAVIMVGQRERRLMRDSADTIHRALAGSELIVVEGCGHGIPLQRPAWFDRRVSEVLAEG